MQLSNPIKAFCSIPKAYRPKASPNGEWIACNWNTTGQFELHGIHVTTGRRHQFTDDDIPLHPEDVSYRWAPDSTALLYRGDKEDSSSVYRSSIDGHNEPLFTIPEDSLLWAVNPVTGYIYYRVDDSTLRWRDPSTGDWDDFACFPGLDIQITGTCAVSPDGQHVAYTSNLPETRTDVTTYESGLTTYIAHADGSDPVRVNVSDHGKRLTPLQWHPHEDKLLVQRDDGHWRDGRTCGIYDYTDETVEWIADIGAVAFFNGGDQILAGAPPRSATTVIDLEGTATAVSCEGLFVECTGSEAVVGDTGFVLQRSLEDRPYEVLAHDVTTDETTVLFGAGYENRGIDPATFVEPTEIQFSLPDGKTAGGLLYHPDRDAATPAVVFFHGMKTQWPHKFRPQVQLLTHLGYTVLLTNCPVDGWSHAEHDVFAAAGRWLAKQDGIDEHRVTAYGHSHGGYNVYMQVVQYPEIWDAFVADTGIVDLRKVMRLGNLRRQLGTPADNPQAYEELSPITHVNDTVGSPLLMIHGEKDGWSDQPRIFKRALQKNGWTNGDEYEYIEMEGVGHTPKSRERQIEWWESIIDFLARHLAE